MTRLFRGTLLHVPDDPFAEQGGGAKRLHLVEDGALAVRSGRIVDAGDATAVRARNPGAETAVTGGWLLPGFVDAHVHYPQLGVMGALGLRLMDWLRQRTWPHEARFADAAFARAEAEGFLAALARNGTTTALVFGAHQALAMEEFFAAADASSLRITTGLTLGDRELPSELRTDPERARQESTELLQRWHGHNRLRYAVTPRFAVSASDELLATCGALLRGGPDGLWFTTHLNESPDEVAFVRNAAPTARDYLDVYDRHGLLGPRSVFAHDVHPSERELARLAETRSVVCHCPGSNRFIGSGLFPLRRHLQHGVRLALGSDVGGGPSFLILNEARAAYETQMQLGEEGVRLDAATLLWLATAGGAHALGLGDQVGDFATGKQADLVQLTPRPGGTLDARLRHAGGADDAAAALIALVGEADVTGSWVAGRRVYPHQ